MLRKYIRLAEIVVSLLFLQLTQAADRPNIVFLLVDDLGWGDFECYGSQFHETPHIDRLASEGMLFKEAYAACTVCSPSRAAILSGRYPARLHLTDWIPGHDFQYAKLSPPDWKMKIDHQRILLPEALKKADYATAFIGKWHLMPKGQSDFDQHYPTSHGFDVNVGGREWGSPKGTGRYFAPFDMINMQEGQNGEFLTDVLTDSALDFLDTTPKQNPFLLYLAYYSLHHPVMAPPELVHKYARKAETFDNQNNEEINPARAGMVETGMVERLDQSVGRIMAKLKQLGLTENTIIILTGDNGGDFAGTSGGLRGHKAYPYEGGTRVPLIVKWTDRIQAGATSEAPVIGTDFYPTLLEMAELPQRPEEHLDGISFWPVLSGKTMELDRKNLYWHFPHNHRTKPYGAIRQGNWKLIEFFEDRRLELYNLKTDSDESKNLAKSHPELTRELLAQMKTWRRAVNAQMPSRNPNHDPEYSHLRNKKKPKK